MRFSGKFKNSQPSVQSSASAVTDRACSFRKLVQDSFPFPHALGPRQILSPTGKQSLQFRNSNASTAKKAQFVCTAHRAANAKPSNKNHSKAGSGEPKLHLSARLFSESLGRVHWFRDCDRAQVTDRKKEDSHNSRRCKCVDEVQRRDRYLKELPRAPTQQIVCISMKTIAARFFAFNTVVKC